MSDLRIPRGQTVKVDVVEGELRVGNNATIEASNGKNVVVTGGVYLEGKAYVNCDLECDSVQSEIFLSKLKDIRGGSNRARLEITGRYAGKLEVTGNLTVHKQLSVSHSVKVSGAINASEIDVGGKVEAGVIKCDRIRVGGRANIQGTFEALSVRVGGKVVALGIVKIGDLDVGGEVDVGGGSIVGSIRVGGKFSSTKPLEFGELMVYGRGWLPAGCKGRKISTFGKLEVDGNLTCDYIHAGGVIELRGDCQAQKIELGGKLSIAGSLVVSDRFEGNGVTEIVHDFESGHMRVSGKFTANKITVREEADVSGKIEAKQGLKAKVVRVRSGTRFEGVLVGEQVHVGKNADLSFGGWWGNLAAAGAGTIVEDIYASEAVVGPMCRAGRIFAGRVTLEQGSAAEQITYTDELKVDFGAAVSEPAKKVEKLPDPPL